MKRTLALVTTVGLITFGIFNILHQQTTKTVRTIPSDTLSIHKTTVPLKKTNKDALNIYTPNITKRSVSLDKDKLLPSKGMLYFFYELETQEWGYSPQDKGCAKVFYFEDTSNFELISFPEDMEDYYKIPEFKVNFKSNISLPSYEDFDNLNKEKNILEKYKEYK